MSSKYKISDGGSFMLILDAELKNSFQVEVNFGYRPLGKYTVLLESILHKYETLLKITFLFNSSDAKLQCATNSNYNTKFL